MEDDLRIEHELHGSHGRYVVTIDGRASELTYARLGERMVINHTYVPPALRNRGIALALVTRAVEDARAQGQKIVPVCSYARAEITAHAEWHDVLAS
ncbi:MAG: GNAT family N-acetyltransferase [Sulfurifustaceae bacterium]